MDLPKHPDADDGDRHEADGRSWAGYLVVGILVVLLIVIVGLHLTGVVGPAAH